MIKIKTLYEVYWTSHVGILIFIIPHSLCLVSMLHVSSYLSYLVMNLYSNPPKFILFKGGVGIWSFFKRSYLRYVGLLYISLSVWEVLKSKTFDYLYNNWLIHFAIWMFVFQQKGVDLVSVLYFRVIQSLLLIGPSDSPLTKRSQRIWVDP